MTLRSLRLTLLRVSITALLVSCISDRDSSSGAGGGRPVKAFGLTQLATAPAVRRVWVFPEYVDWVRPSSDGRRFSYINITSGDIMLYDLALGTEHRVTLSPGELEDDGWAQSPSISPDGQSVAYSWYAAKPERLEVRIVGIRGADSGKIRMAHTWPGRSGVAVQSWTPDGKEVLATVVQPTRKVEIVAIRTRGDGIRSLRTIGWPGANSIAVSPDGRWIAYDQWSNDKAKSDVHIMGIDGTNDQTVPDNGVGTLLMGWAGNSRLLLASTQGSPPLVWSLAVANGKPISTGVLVRSNMWGIAPVGTSSSGAAFYTVSKGECGLYTVPIDPETSAISQRGIAIRGEYPICRDQPFAWSAHGGYFAFGAQRPGFVSDDVIIRSVSRGDVRRLSPRFSGIQRVQWYPDDRAVLLVGWNHEGKGGLFKMDLESASLTHLPTPSGTPWPFGMAFSLDGQNIFFIGRAFTGGSTDDVLIHRLDRVSGEVSLLRRIKGAGRPEGLSLSPDGRSLAFLTTDLGDRPIGRVIVAPLDQGAHRVVYQAVPPERLAWAGVAWTADGRHLIFGVHPATKNYAAELPLFGPAARKEITELRRLSLDDGTVVSTGFQQAGLTGFQISPDGRTLMYGVNRRALELWMMEPPVFEAVLPPGKSN